MQPGMRRNCNFPCGILRVSVISAQGIRGDETFGLGRADPYAKLTIGPPQCRRVFLTSTDEDAGATPLWGEMFTIGIAEPNIPEYNDILVQIYNRNTLRPDNLIGYCHVNNLAEDVMRCEKLSTGGTWYPVYDPKTQQPRGEISMLVRFEPMTEAGIEKWVSDQEQARLVRTKGLS